MRTGTITVFAEFHVPAHVLYEMFATEHGYRRLGLGKKADFPGIVGAPYSIFEGKITGKIVALEPNSKVVLTMKIDGKPSTAAISFEPIGTEKTRITVVHEGLDVNGKTNADRDMKAMWEQCFWTVLDKFCGYGRCKVDEDEE